MKFLFILCVLYCNYSDSFLLQNIYLKSSDYGGKPILIYFQIIIVRNCTSLQGELRVYGPGGTKLDPLSWTLARKYAPAMFATELL